MSDITTAYWMVQPAGRRRFLALAEAERTATIINNAIERGLLAQEPVSVVAYNKTGKAIQHA